MVRIQEVDSVAIAEAILQLAVDVGANEIAQHGVFIRMAPENDASRCVGGNDVCGQGRRPADDVGRGPVDIDSRRLIPRGNTVFIDSDVVPLDQIVAGGRAGQSDAVKVVAIDGIGPCHRGSSDDIVGCPLLDLDAVMCVAANRIKNDVVVL